MPGITAAALQGAVKETLASMRPQLNAGDNQLLQVPSQCGCLCFNEAPAKCRG